MGPGHEVRMGYNTKGQLAARPHGKGTIMERPGGRAGERAEASWRGAWATRAKLIQSKNWALEEGFSKRDYEG